MLKNHIFRQYILFCLCALLVSGCGGSSVPSAPTATAQAQRAIRMATQIATELNSIYETIAKWPVVISDPFDENAIGWATGDEVEPDLASIRWDIDGGKYRWEAQAVDSFVWWAVPDMDEVADFHVRVAARQLNTPELGEYGLVFRLTEDGSYYLFEISETGQAAVFLHTPDGWEVLRTWFDSQAISPGQTNLLAVAAEGDEFYFFVNDQLVSRLRDSRLPAGKIGLLIGLSNPGDKATWMFDDFELRAPANNDAVTP